jgi:hypothetical protein
MMLAADNCEGTGASLILSKKQLFNLSKTTFITTFTKIQGISLFVWLYLTVGY